MNAFSLLVTQCARALALGVFLTACSPGPAAVAAPAVRATATTTMITELVQRIGGDRVTVQGLMGPGVDPHLYKATASDVSKLQKAQVVFYNGLLLEGKMQELFEGMKKTKVYAITDDLPKEQLLHPPGTGAHADPHIWFDLQLWAKTVPAVVKGLSAVDPANQALYTANGEKVTKELATLHEWTVKKIAELPQEKRILVTSHDAYNYFGRAYGFQVVGLQGISTVTEAGLADMANMVDFIKAKKIKAIFVESSVPHNTIERISKDAGVKVGGEIFSDAMGTPGEMEAGYDLGTFEGMIKHNVSTIVDSLK